MSTPCTSYIGINNLALPIQIQERGGSLVHSIANCRCSAEVAAGEQPDLKREVSKILPGLCQEIDPKKWMQELQKLANTIAAEQVTLSIDFPFYLNKKAPVSEMMGFMEYECQLKASNLQKRIDLALKIPVTTLCPCSKEISDGGAHNQRAEAILQLEMTQHIWIEELIELVEESASCPVFSVLKRPDEKYVTERAFHNPMFVEDVVRKIALKAAAHGKINKFSISVESFESIHKHNAYALVNSEDLNRKK